MFGLKKLLTKGNLLVLSNTVSQSVAKIITAGISFIISVIIARKYGTEGYGDFTKVFSLVTFFYLVCDFGINVIFLEQEKEDRSWWPALLGLRIFISLMMTFVLLAVLSFLPYSGPNGYTSPVKLAIVIFAPTIFFQSLITSANAVFQKNLKYEFSAISIITGSLLSLILVYISAQLIVDRYALLFIVGSLSVGSALGSVFALGFANKFTPVKIRFDLKKIKYLFVQSIPFGLTLVLNLVYFRADTFILTISRTTGEVGVYGLAYKVFEFALVIPTFFMNAVYPLMLDKYDAKDGNIRNILPLIKKSFLFLILTSVFLSLCLWYIADFFVLIRPGFAPGIPALRILAVGLPFFFVSSLCMWLLIIFKKRYQMLLIYTVSMIINVIFNIIYIPKYGIYAASWITVFSEMLVLMMSIGLIHQIINNLIKQNKYD